MKEKIIRMIELLAERESLALKVDYAKVKKQESQELVEKLKKIENEINSLTNIINTANITFYLFGFDELVATENILSLPAEERVAAIETKNGQLFETIKKRLLSLKKNVEMKNELATLFCILSTIRNDETKKAVITAIRKQEPIKQEELDCKDENIRKIALLLSRFGLYSIEQKKYVVSRDVIWLEGEEAKRMDGILAELAKLEPALQWKNAQRQIKTFTDEEEKEFVEVQKKYLELLNLRDQLIDEYKKREEALNRI